MSRNLRSLGCFIVAGMMTSLVCAGAHAQIQTARTVVRDVASELACAARSTTAAPPATMRIIGGREKGKGLFGPGDPVIVGAGTSQGLKVGQEYFVRRVIADRFLMPGSDDTATLSIHTAGWIRIVEVQTDAAIGTVTHACDAMVDGDYLEPFQIPALPAPSTAAGEPDYANPGRLIVGDERRQMGATGDLMVFDRGSDHGVRAGQRVTIFRETAGRMGPVVRIGEATAMIVSPESTVLRIDKSTDAVYVGDLVAIHR